MKIATPTTFRLGDGEPVPDGIRRIARGRLDVAIQGLTAAHDGDLDTAIHEARKALKRLRATVRLARDDIGDEVYRHENTTFRDAGRRLSGARDSQVMIETLDELTARCADELPADAFGGLRDALAAEYEAVHRRVAEQADDGPGAVVAELEQALGRTATWPLAHDDPSALAPGFRRIYRRGRRELRRAHAEGGDEALHDLRKRAKDLWYAAQIIGPLAPKRTRRLAKRAHKLSDLIGLDHDLAVLHETADRRQDDLSRGELAQLDELIARRRADLQRRALARADRLYARKPKRAVRRIGLS